MFYEPNIVGLIINVVVGCLEQILELLLEFMKELIMQYWEIQIQGIWNYGGTQFPLTSSLRQTINIWVNLKYSNIFEFEEVLFVFTNILMFNIY